jgi:hypothetical protein
MNNHIINLLELFQEEIGVNSPSELAVQQARDQILEFIKDKKVMIKALVAAHGGKPRKRKKQEDNKH